MSNPTPGSTPPEDSRPTVQTPAGQTPAGETAGGVADKPDALGNEPEAAAPEDQRRESAELGLPGADDTRAEHAHAHTPEIADQAYAPAASDNDHDHPAVITPSEPQTNTTSLDYPREAYNEPAARSQHPHAPAGPVFVQAPTPPQKKGNRGFGILVSLLAAVAFAIVYGGVLALITFLGMGSVNVVGGILVRAPFWLPVIVFFVAMVVLVAIVNRGGWWAYVTGGFLVALLVYGGYLGGVLIEQAYSLTPGDVGPFVTSILLTPPAVVAFVVGREVPVWFGAWIAARGRKVRERNDEQQREYERLLEQGPAADRS